jgi:hypothetical protein
MAKKDILDFAEPRVKLALQATKEPWAQLVAMETRGQQALKETPAQPVLQAKRARKVLQVLVETRVRKVPKVRPAKLAQLAAKAT